VKFSIMYLSERLPGYANKSKTTAEAYTQYKVKIDGYRQLPSAILSEETQAKVIEEITLHLESAGFKKHISKVMGENG